MTLIWVLRHIRIEGNEKADALARNNSDSQFVRPEQSIPVSLFEKTIIKKWKSSWFKNYWKSVSK